MLLAGTDDGLYRVDGESGDARRVLDAGAVFRLRSFDGVDGAFAATETGLYYGRGRDWTDLGVPRDRVYAVGAGPDGALYAGTRPAHLYAATLESPLSGGLDWRELDGLQDVPSRADWRLPRHDDLAQVRDVHALDGGRVVVGVEVGGVHVSDDGGRTWTERRGRVHDDVHELAVAGRDEFVAATGFGLFHTADAGRTWTRLDGGHDQRYFRSVAVADDAVYAGGALAHTATWTDEDAAPALLAVRDGSVDAVDHPRGGETVTGITTQDGDVVFGTHTGALVRQRGDDWVTVGSVPVADPPVGYTPLLSDAD
ncbi:WD40/YVTN/BNR-like repeat-containing protein [Halobacterium yunchengense]|uniref:WD40/YVTN/BNR-like repeat-containing protein n=1 Tax=Halobacterium yunchengense TaxID=3108497 RepID=UPI0030082D11